MTRARFTTFVACLVWSACQCSPGLPDGGDGDEDGGFDGGTADARPDAGADDAGADAGTADSGTDAGPDDAGADAGADDGGADAGTVDAGTDAGADDAGADGGAEDAGVVCPVEDAGAPFNLRCPQVPSGCPPPPVRRATIFDTRWPWSVSLARVDGGVLLVHAEADGRFLVQRLDEGLNPTGTSFTFGATGMTAVSADLTRAGSAVALGFVQWPPSYPFTGPGRVGVVWLDETGAPILKSDGGAEHIVWSDSVRAAVYARFAAAGDRRLATFIEYSIDWAGYSSEITGLITDADGNVASGPRVIATANPDAGLPAVQVHSVGAADAGFLIGLRTSNPNGWTPFISEVRQLAPDLSPLGAPIEIPYRSGWSRVWVNQVAPEAPEPALAFAWVQPTDAGRALFVHPDSRAPLSASPPWVEGRDPAPVVFLNAALLSSRSGLFAFHSEMKQRSTTWGYEGRLLMTHGGPDASVDITGHADPLFIWGFHREVDLYPLSASAVLATVVLEIPDGGARVEAWRVCLP